MKERGGGKKMQHTKTERMSENKWRGREVSNIVPFSLEMLGSGQKAQSAPRSWGSNMELQHPECHISKLKHKKLLCPYKMLFLTRTTCMRSANPKPSQHWLPNLFPCSLHPKQQWPHRPSQSGSFHFSLPCSLSYTNFLPFSWGCNSSKRNCPLYEGLSKVCFNHLSYLLNHHLFVFFFNFCKYF